MGNTCTPQKKVPVPEDVLGQGCVLGRCRSSRAGQEAPGQCRSLWVKKTPNLQDPKNGLLFSEQRLRHQGQPHPHVSPGLGRNHDTLATLQPVGKSGYPGSSRHGSSAGAAHCRQVQAGDLTTAGKPALRAEPVAVPEIQPSREGKAEPGWQKPARRRLLPACTSAGLAVLPPQQGMNLHGPQRGAMRWAGQSRSACQDMPGYRPISIWEEVSGSPGTVSSPRTLQYSNAPAGEEAP